MHTVIFEADTPAGKRFDVALLWAIVVSVAAVLVESVASVREAYGTELRALEIVFTGLFTVEYALRLLSVRRPLKYMFSFYGLVDLLSILPTFVEVLLPGAASLRVVRMLRLLRVFRVLKLVGFLREAQTLKDALWASRRKIVVFLSAVLVLVTLLGTVVYIVEDAEAGYEHPNQHLLGHCDCHHCGVRGHRAADRVGPNACVAHDDSGLRHHRGPHRHCGRRIGPLRTG